MGKSLFAFVSAAVAVAVSVAVGLLGAGRAAAVPFDPIPTPPPFRGGVPTPEQGLGFPIGSRESAAAEIATYVSAVDAASPRVVSAQFATSWEGRPLNYAIVGRPENVPPAGLATLRANAAALRDPSTPTDEAGRLAASSPA